MHEIIYFQSLQVFYKKQTQIKADFHRLIIRGFLTFRQRLKHIFNPGTKIEKKPKLISGQKTVEWLKTDFHKKRTGLKSGLSLQPNFIENILNAKMLN